MSVLMAQDVPKVAVQASELLSLQHDPLLREADHRVRNSLQLVAAVLELQIRHNPGDPTLRSALTEAIRRIRAIAQVHEQLRRCDDTVEVSSYLDKLCTDLSRSLMESRTVEIEVEKIHLPTKRAVALGLIVTELVTDGSKHGRRVGSGEGVRVILSRSSNGMLRLVVSDEGPGLPADFDPAATQGVGMQLVRRLVGQLSGRLEIDRGTSGTSFIVHFAAEEPVVGTERPISSSDT